MNFATKTRRCHIFITYSHQEKWNHYCLLANMRKKIRIILFAAAFMIGLLVFTGCQYDIKTIPLSLDVREGTLNNMPIPEEEVEIFRSTKADPCMYKGIGIIIINGSSSDVEIESIYSLMRKEAAKRGAGYIVDFKLKMEKKKECTTNEDNETKCKDIYNFTATGTMVARVLSSDI